MENEKMDIQLTKPRLDGRQWLRFTQTTFDDVGEAVFQQTGFLEVNPKKAAEVLALYQSGTRKKAFGKLNKLTGFYDLIAVRGDGSRENPGIVDHENDLEPSIVHVAR